MAITGADIVVKFSAQGADKTTGAINRVGNAVDGADKKGRGFLGTMTNVAGGFLMANVITAGAGAILGYGKALINTSADLEAFENQLTIATGSQEKAIDIMDRTIQMAKKTPFEQNELIRGAANLEALGMSSQKWMPIIGDTAAGVNKSIDQTVQAVLDASSGEFERLKEFGIRSKVEGDKVKFSFMQNGKEMVVEAQNTQEGISSALMGIWDQKYDGAMETMANSFTGRLSTLKDNIFLLAQGWFDPVFDSISAGMGRINDFFEQADVVGFGRAFGDLAEDIAGAIGDIASTLGGLVVDLGAWTLNTGIPTVIGWLADAAVGVWDALKTAAGWAWDNRADLGNITAVISGWLPEMAAGATSLWESIKAKAWEWLTGEKPMELPTIDVDASAFNANVDGGKLWSDITSGVQGFLGGGGSTLGAGGGMAGGGIRAAIQAPPIAITVDQFAPQVSAGALWDALKAKVDEMITVSDAEAAAFAPKGREIGATIMRGLIDGITSVFGGGEGVAAGGFAAGGGGPLGAGGQLGGGLWRFIEPMLAGAWDELESSVEGWVASRDLDLDWSQILQETLGLEEGGIVRQTIKAVIDWEVDLGTGGGLQDLAIDWTLFVMKFLGLPHTGLVEETVTAVIKWEVDLTTEGLMSPMEMVEFALGAMVPGGSLILDIPTKINFDFGGGDAQKKTGPKIPDGALGAIGQGALEGMDTLTYDPPPGLGGGGTEKFLGAAPDFGPLKAAISAGMDEITGIIGTKAGEWGTAIQSGAASLGASAEQMLAKIAGVGSALAGIDGTSATVSILGDNVGALAAVDASAAALGGIHGRIAQTFVNGDNSNALGAIGAAAGEMAGFDGTVATGYLNAINNVGGAVGAAINDLLRFDGMTATAYINTVNTGANIGQALAGGGYVRSGMQLVGEEGPELVSLPVGSYVHTASKTERMMAGGAPVTINIEAPLNIENHGDATDEQFLRWSKLHIQGMAMAERNIRRSLGVS